jgi:hypothetical protein
LGQHILAASATQYVCKITASNQERANPSLILVITLRRLFVNYTLFTRNHEHISGPSPQFFSFRALKLAEIIQPSVYNQFLLFGASIME